MVALVLLSWAALAEAQEESPTVDDLLAQGWHYYSEELDFEAALRAYEEASSHPDATDEQLLEALEYVAACRFALGDRDGAREALQELVHIDHDHRLSDPSHPPDLLQMLEEVRREVPAPTQSATEGAEAADSTPTFGEGESERGEESESEEAGVPLDEGEGEPEGHRPVYRRWWFWTLTALVVVGVGVGVGVGLGTRGTVQEPPGGSLEPGVVQLPCVIEF